MTPRRCPYTTFICVMCFQLADQLSIVIVEVPKALDRKGGQLKLQSRWANTPDNYSVPVCGPQG